MRTARSRRSKRRHTQRNKLIIGGLPTETMTMTVPAPITAPTLTPKPNMFPGPGNILGSFLDAPPSPIVPSAPPPSRNTSSNGESETVDVSALEMYFNSKIETTTDRIGLDTDLLPIIFTGTCGEMPDYPIKLRNFPFHADYVASINPYDVTNEGYDEIALKFDSMHLAFANPSAPLQSGGACEYVENPYIDYASLPDTTEGLNLQQKIHWFETLFAKADTSFTLTNRCDQFIACTLFNAVYQKTNNDNKISSSRVGEIPTISVDKKQEITVSVRRIAEWSKLVESISSKKAAIDTTGRISAIFRVGLTKIYRMLPMGWSLESSLKVLVEDPSLLLAISNENSYRDEDYTFKKLMDVYNTLSLKYLVCFAILYKNCDPVNGEILQMNRFFHTFTNFVSTTEEKVPYSFIPVIGSFGVDTPTSANLRSMFSKLFKLPTTKLDVLVKNIADLHENTHVEDGVLDQDILKRSWLNVKINQQSSAEPSEEVMRVGEGVVEKTQRVMEFKYSANDVDVTFDINPFIKSNNDFTLASIFTSIAYSQTKAIKKVLHRPDKGIHHVTGLDKDPEWNGLMHRIHVFLDTRNISDIKAYIVFRGSHTSRDWTEADQQIASGTAAYLLKRTQDIPNLVRTAQESIATYLDEKQFRNIANITLYSTGHSLGGFLAMMTASKSYSEEIVVKDGLGGRKFNKRIVPIVFNPFFGDNELNFFPILFVPGDIFTVVGDRIKPMDIASAGIISVERYIAANVHKIFDTNILIHKIYHSMGGVSWAKTYADPHFMYQFIGSLEYYINSDVGQRITTERTSQWVSTPVGKGLKNGNTQKMVADRKAINDSTNAAPVYKNINIEKYTPFRRDGLYRTQEYSEWENDISLYVEELL